MVGAGERDQDEDEWRDAIEKLYMDDRNRIDIVAFVMERATIQTQVQVQIG